MPKIISGWTAEAGVRNLERAIGRICRKVAAKVASDEIKKESITQKKLIDYLLSRGTEETLCRSKSAQIPLRTDLSLVPELPHIETARWMKVEFEDVADQLENSTRFAHTLAGYSSSSQ